MTCLSNTTSVDDEMKVIHCMLKEIFILDGKYPRASGLWHIRYKLELSANKKGSRSQTKKEALVKVGSPVSNAILRTSNA